MEDDPVVEFSTYEDVGRWLDRKPREIAIVIASRAVLRALPALAILIDKRRQSIQPIGRSGHILAVFRAVAVSWAAAKYSRHHPGLRFVANRAADAAYALFDHDVRESGYGHVVRAAFAAADAAAASGRDIEARYSVAALDAIRSAALAAAAAAYDAADGYVVPDPAALAATDVLLAAAADASALEQGTSPADQADRKLWLKEVPIWTREAWIRLRYALLDQREDWEVWIDWYEARVRGGSADVALDVACVKIAEQFWKQGPQVVNAEIRRLMEGHKRAIPVAKWGEAKWDEARWGQKREPPSVPAQRRAAVEPFWDKGTLTVPKKPVRSDLNKKKFAAALSALRTEMRELAGDVAAEANIDKRPAVQLQRVADCIPETLPTQDELFRLGHAESVFVGFAKTVEREWPDFLAARYQALLLQFDRTMRQSPLWREFKRNAAKETLSAEQVKESVSLARQAARALEQKEAKDFVDPAVPHSLQQLAEASNIVSVEGTPSVDASTSAQELLAVDLVESVNNTLKPIAEAALASAARAEKRAASAAGKMAGAYASEFEKGAVAEAKK